MSALTYKLIWCTGWHVVSLCTRPAFLHRERARRKGAYILAPNHTSPYDIPGLMHACPRDLDFVSIVEMKRNSLVRLLFAGMNVVFLDRGKVDTVTTRQIMDRLRRGRVIAMFPEGRIVTDDAQSVINGGPIKPGVVRIAQAANVPIVPCVILNTRVLSKFKSWLPIRSARYGVIFGEPITVDQQPDPDAAQQAAIEKLKLAYRTLSDELRQAL